MAYSRVYLQYHTVNQVYNMVYYTLYRWRSCYLSLKYTFHSFKRKYYTFQVVAGSWIGSVAALVWFLFTQYCLTPYFQVITGTSSLYTGRSKEKFMIESVA